VKPRFKKGDTVTMYGRRIVIDYWPPDNQNSFTAHGTSHDGGEERFTYHVSQYAGEPEAGITDTDVAATGVSSGPRETKKG
jgi:hypothetical protein